MAEVLCDSATSGKQLLLLALFAMSATRRHTLRREDHWVSCNLGSKPCGCPFCREARGFEPGEEFDEDTLRALEKRITPARAGNR